MTFRKLSKCNKDIVTDICSCLQDGKQKEGIMILKKILKLAEKNNISISCLEKTLSFGNGTIKKWGESSPSVDKLKKVADYFGVSVDYFLE